MPFHISDMVYYNLKSFLCQPNSIISVQLRIATPKLKILLVFGQNKQKNEDSRLNK